MMKTNRQNLGHEGENLAVRYLQDQGYEILQRNWRIGRAEVDIIALDRDDLAIIEVKSVYSLNLGFGEERISRRKKTMLILAAYGFLELFPELSSKNLRFDVIVIDFTCYPAAVAHYPAAFWQQSDDFR
jgi:putative endonuclease